jgi:hypothetical protein
MVTRIGRIASALTQAFHAMDTNRRIRFTKSLYLQLPKLKLNLVSAIGGESVAMELSIPEARMIFQSIKSALELKDHQQIEVGEIIWATDCRVQAENTERVAIKFKGPNGSVHTVLQRENIAAALEEFESKLLSAL